MLTVAGQGFSAVVPRSRIHDTEGSVDELGHMAPSCTTVVQADSVGEALEAARATWASERDPRRLRRELLRLLAELEGE